MTAASSPPPRDGEVCGAWAPKVWMEPQRLCDQPSGHPPLVLNGATFDHRWRAQHWNGDRRPAAPSEPPAETQQDDERERIIRLISDLYGPGHAWQLPGQSRQDLTEANVALVRTFLAARPSADTEKLRDALRLIAGPAPHCAASTTERHSCRQPGSGRTRGARYGADAWCDQCIARAALDGDTKTLRQVKLAPEPCWLPRCAGTDGSCGHSEFGS